MIGAIFLWGVLIAVPDMGEAVAGFFGPATDHRRRCSSDALTVIYLFVVVGVDLRVLHVDPDLDDPTGVRDGARQPAAVLQDDGEGESQAAHAGRDLRDHRALAAIPFIQFAGASRIAVGATASIYFSYLLGNLAVMRARMRGWPKTKAPFSLGGWGKVVNVVAIVWGVAMLLNFLTPASATVAFDPNASGANYLRIFANPKAVQTD